MRAGIILTLALAGCTGAVAANATIDGDDDPITDPDSGATTQRPSGSSGTSSSSSGGSSSGGSSSSSSGEADSGPDAEPDAAVVTDSGSDATATADAGPDATEPVDAGPPECAEGATRCDSYHQDACVGGHWATTTSEACCFTEGRYGASNGGWIYDSQTNTGFRSDVWTYASGADAASVCHFAYGGKLPTREQLLSQVLPGQDVCNPGLDEHSFTENGGPLVTSVFFTRVANNGPDECVSTITREPVPCTSVAKPAFTCVVGP